MATIIDRAVRNLTARQVAHRVEADGNAIHVVARDADGFDVRLRILGDRAFLVQCEGWSHDFDRAEDAYDCFEYVLSDSARLKITIRGEVPVAWQIEKREYGMWVPARHATRRRLVAFWRPARTTYRQNTVFRRHACEPGADQTAPAGV